MSLIAFGKAETDIDYGAMRALVVDDYPGMRNAMRITLSNFGLTKIDMSANATEVLFKVQHNEYDLILCDFNLGDGRDGQQVLEELRHRGLITLDTAFIMVTAESVYEKVAATAELAPDDYLIKPFNAEILRHRLDGILRRKLAFADIYRYFSGGELEKALECCDLLIKEKPKYIVDTLRFKGELLNAMGRFEDAEALYKQVIQMRAIPWARLGLARTLHMQKKDEAAEELLHDVLEDSPELVSAYDLMAEVKLARNDAREAQAALEKGAAISGKTVRRQQRLGEVAFANGDLDKARAAFSAALDKGRHSIFVTPADYGNLCRVQVEQGDMNGALDTLKKGKMALHSSPEGQLVSAVVQGLVHTKSGRAAEAGRALDEAVRLRNVGARADEQSMLDLAGVCMANGRLEEGDAIVREVARNAHDSDTLMAKARQLYEATGRGEAGDQVLKEATAEVRRLNNEGVMLAHKGDYAAAVECMLAASREAPFNPRVIMNTAWVILKRIDQEGMDHDLFAEARRLIEEAGRQSPGHTRITGLRSHLKQVEGRFGIHGSKKK